MGSGAPAALKKEETPTVLSFKSPNLKPNNERNLRCQPPCRETTSSTPANTAAIRTQTAAQNPCPSCSTATAAPAAADRWTTSTTNCSPKKMPSSANRTAQLRHSGVPCSGRRDRRNTLRRASSSLLFTLLCCFSQLINAQRRNFFSPLIDSLDRDPQRGGDLLHRAELFNCVFKSHASFNHSLNKTCNRSLIACR